MGEARGWVKVNILFFFISFHLCHSKGGVEVANPITPSASANKGYFINITCASYGIYTKNDTTENNIYLSITICAIYSVTNNCGKISEKVIPLPTAAFGSKGSLVRTICLWIWLQQSIIRDGYDQVKNVIYFIGTYLYPVFQNP